jgi:SagB-type dehydrogenase family enzyme
MSDGTWEAMRLAQNQNSEVFELFHENSKTSHCSPLEFSEHEIVARMQEMWESLPYDLYPAIALPCPLTPLRITLEEAILTRVTARAMEPCTITLENVATILHCAYGVTRSNEGAPWPHPFRTVPSGGALYPLEIFFHTTHVDGLSAGLYHFNPARNNLRLLVEQDQSAKVADCLVQQNLAYDASVIFFITAIFERSTFKYGERGYRFVLLEAGHVAQNINLVANGLGLGSVNIGGFFDRQVDELLGLDGVTHSTIYLAAVGKPLLEPEQQPPVHFLVGQGVYDTV